jgi:hypothetical protein
MQPFLAIGCFTADAPRTILILERRETRMAKPGQHVVPNGAKWSVRRAGASKASGTFRTQQEAIDRARAIAQSQGTELFIHGPDGRIRERNSYGNDPLPPKR